MGGGVRDRLLSFRSMAAFGGVALVVAMAVDTEFLDPTEQSTAQAPTFSPAAYVDEHFPETARMISEAAVELPALADALADDAAAARAEYGVDAGSGAFVFPVVVTGSVAEVDDRFITLAVDGMPEGADVRIPLTTALNGAPIRDVTGTALFGDFADQTEYQEVANEYKLSVRDDVIGALDLAALDGKTLDVVGAWAQGGPPDTYLIQPVIIGVSG